MAEWAEADDAGEPGLDLLTSSHRTFREVLGAVVTEIGLKRMVDPDRPTPRCGRFELRDVLGSGGFGLVLLAWDPELEREVALKICTRAPPFDSTAFLSEARSAARLAHPNIITIHEVIVEGDRLALAMEYVSRQTLYHYAVKGKAESLQTLIQIFVGIARGLAAAHDEGIVHRDLKPQNILLHKDLRPRVADFGIARSMATPKWTDAAVGTQCYVAPEILAAVGLELGDARSDQWSFFVMLCQCLDGWLPMLPPRTREPPKSDARTLRLIRRWLRREELVDAEIPDALAKILRVGLSLDPDERFPNMHVVADELEKLFVRGLVAGPAVEVAPSSESVAPSSEGVVVSPVSDEAVALAPTWWKKWGLSALLLVMAPVLVGQTYLLTREKSGEENGKQDESASDSADQSRRGEDSPCVADGVPIDVDGELIESDASVRATCRVLRTDGLQEAVDLWIELAVSRESKAKSDADWLKLACDTTVIAQTFLYEADTADPERARQLREAAVRLAELAKWHLSHMDEEETADAASSARSVVEGLEVHQSGD